MEALETACLSKETKQKYLSIVGVSAKKIKEGLESINIDINEINAILVTHEHIDHIRSIGTIAKKYNIPIYANLGTWNGIENEKTVINVENKNYFKIGEKFKIEIGRAHV